MGQCKLSRQLIKICNRLAFFPGQLATDAQSIHGMDLSLLEWHLYLKLKALLIMDGMTLNSTLGFQNVT